ncbi:MAG: Arm DNA-binding domain-containing protein [Desulfobacterales bacterium]
MTVSAHTVEGDTVMSLTDTAIRNAKPEEKQYKLTDGKGMYVLVITHGYARLHCRIYMDNVKI